MTGSEPRRAPLLELREIEFSYPGGVPIFDGLSLEIGPAETVAVLGPSGCGKSTMLRIAAGLVSPAVGERICRAEVISQVFQTPRLLPWRTALGNVLLPGRLGRRPESVDPDLGRALLERVGLAEQFENRPREMSLGMQMRVAIARALATSPDLLLLDEPFAAVDEPTRRRLNRMFGQLRRARPLAAIYVTHSVAEAIDIADRVVVVGRPPVSFVESFVVPTATGAETNEARRALREQISRLLDQSLPRESEGSVGLR